VATIKGGKRLPLGVEFAASPTRHPYIRARDLGNGPIKIVEPVFLDEDTAAKLHRYTVCTGDICLTIVGANVGEMGVVPPELNGANLTENAVRIVAGPQLDQKFLAYVLCSDRLIQQMKVLAGGAAQPKLGIYKIESLELPLPQLDEQRRIAGIVSAYDDLIENCQRRIKILEELARSLYREWFVHFRYPSHEEEQAPQNASDECLPASWKLLPCAALGTYLNGYAFKPSDLGAEGRIVVKIKELKNGVAGNTPRNLGEGIPDKFQVEDGDILFSWSADLDAYVWMGGPGLLNQHLFNVLPNKGYPKFWLYHSLKEVMPRFRALSLGATMHHIKRSALDQVSIATPPAALRHQFEHLVSPIHHQIILLNRTSTNLCQTRDLLLEQLLRTTPIT
jgi:type I restriction enzyme S subunit